MMNPPTLDPAAAEQTDDPGVESPFTAPMNPGDDDAPPVAPQRTLGRAVAHYAGRVAIAAVYAVGAIGVIGALAAGAVVSALPSLGLTIILAAAYHKRHDIVSNVNKWRSTRAVARAQAREPQAQEPDLDSPDVAGPEVEGPSTAGPEVATPEASTPEAAQAPTRPTRTRRTPARAQAQAEAETPTQVLPATSARAPEATATAAPKAPSAPRQRRPAAEAPAALEVAPEPTATPRTREQRHADYFGEILTMIQAAPDADTARAVATRALADHAQAVGKEAKIYSKTLTAMAKSNVSLAVMKTFSEGTLEAHPIPAVEVAAAPAPTAAERAAKLGTRPAHAATPKERAAAKPAVSTEEAARKLAARPAHAKAATAAPKVDAPAARAHSGRPKAEAAQMPTAPRARAPRARAASSGPSVGGLG